MNDNDLKLVSHLPLSCREDLERLMFFNAHQGRFAEGIMRSIEAFGMPEVIEEGEELRIEIKGLAGAQALFATEDEPSGPRPIALLIYQRVDEESLALLHVGVREDHAAGGEFADRLVLIRLIASLRRAARSIRGIREIVMMYAGGATARIPVR
jgi:hypothetical protein